MPSNYILLERIELNASAASVTFSNIPQTGYTDLKIVGSVRTTNASTYGAVDMTFNGTTTGYSSRNIEGGDGAAASFTSTGASSLKAGYVSGGNATANTFGTFEVYIPNYTSSTNKSISIDSAGETNAANGIYMDLWASLWANTAAINSITLSSGNTLAQYSTFSLYGLAALGTTPVIAPKASGGNRVDNDGTYWYHTFTSSGTFTPQTSLSCDVLQIAGGGGGQAGGGGAGGLAYTSSNSLSATNYTVTIGAGGANDASGVNSSFGALTAAVGGGGGSGWGTVGKNGGSGGGGGSVSGTTVNGGTGTSGQGNNGGSGVSERAGGGGGASAVGSNGVGGGSGGAGGAGSSAYSSWASATTTGVSGAYAGGGGGGANGTGGAGGSGGGGTGSNASPTAGTVNTGGGGGGAYNAAGQPGGSGIVIIRYAV
jgi:hypothetical protein